MSLTYGTGSGFSGEFKPVGPGTHFAVCTAVVDVGVQPGSAKFPKPRRLLMLRFEVPAERVTTADGDMPAIIWQRYTASMNSKALLRGAVEGWLGRGLSDDEAARVDLTKLAGKAATITVTHTNKGDKVYANVSGIGPLPKGVQPPTAEGDIVVYHAGKKDQFNELPEFLQKMINEQLPEHAAQTSGDDDAEESRATEDAGSPAVVAAAPTASGPKMTAAAEYTYAEYIEAGWDDAALIEAGYMEAPKAAPPPPPKKVAPPPPKKAAPPPPKKAVQEHPVVLEDDVPVPAAAKPAPPPAKAAAPKPAAPAPVAKADTTDDLDDILANLE